MSSVTTAAEEQIDFVPLDNAAAFDRTRSRRRRREVYLVFWGLPIILFVVIALLGPVLVPDDWVTIALTGARNADEVLGEVAAADTCWAAMNLLKSTPSWRTPLA